MPDTVSPRKQSLVRVKSVALLAVFLGCLIGIDNRSPHALALILVAGVSSMLQYLVRCESCHSSIYYRAGGDRTFIARPRAFRFLYSNRCPYCGLERF